MTRRDEVLSAAIQVTAEHGVRGLTHRAVDVAGVLPSGTTSNYFRSRPSLTTGTLERLAEIMAGIIANVSSTPVTSEEDLIQTLGGNLGFALGPGKTIASALAAMFTEAAIDESLHDTVVATNKLWWSAIEAMLVTAGITDQTAHRARCLLSYGNGLVVDQLAIRNPDFDPIAAMRIGVQGFCR